ncbi:MAG: DNA repair protein RecO [Lachnospiraceae bacterium]|nr:DNA repair protein RecO [Lachnospiraceae bacterium]MDD3615798.1 DNA repair protein RecO [Lachnospiraceae bacterium]
MREAVKASGVIVSSMPVGDYDNRLVILTKELGKITAFARGARRSNNPLSAVSNTFVFGTFSLYEGKNAYTLAEASVIHYFRELAGQQPEVYYGYYFLELAAYFASENMDESQLVNLIYVALRALQNPLIDNDLVRAVYELRILSINGEYAVLDVDASDETMVYILQYILNAPLPKLFHFKVKDEILTRLKWIAQKYRERAVDRRIKSLDILEMMLWTG